MSKLIYTSYSPNTRFKDLSVNVGLLLKPWTWKLGESSKNITELFESKFSGSKAFTYNYARSGMIELFKALNLNDEDEVLIQGFTCVAAVNPVLWSGAKVKYVDIDQNSLNMDLNDLKSKISDKTKVVMFQYTFGNSNGIEEVVELCRDRNLLLIEDCTNTIFGKHKNSYIGSFGDASIFSFGRDKAVSGVDGGLILVNNIELKDRLESRYLNLDYPSLNWIWHELIYPIVWAKIKATFTFFKLGKVIHFIATKLGLIGRATSDNEKIGNPEGFVVAKCPNAMAKLAITQLEDIDEINSHRKMVEKIYRSKLNLKISFNNYPENILLRFPILIDSKEKFMNYMKNENIILGDWYSQPVDPASVDLESVNYTFGLCKNSESICKKIVNLPTHINISEQDVTKIANLINKYYGNKQD